MTDLTTETPRPVRRRGIFRIDEQTLADLINLPEGQRVIGFRTDPAQLCIDVCVEGDGLPECPPMAEPKVVNAERYVSRFSQWAFRGRDLEEMVDVLISEMEPVERGSLPDVLRRTLDGNFDPRQHVGGSGDA